MNQKIRKAVIPAAGLGTRFLPVTKSIPKEMIPIIDKPMLHYIVEEAVNSGIQDVVLVSSRNKESIEQYFVYNYELEDRLMKSGKEEQAKEIKKIADSCNIIVVFQKEPLGLGHAVGCAKRVVGSDPFAVLLGDDLIDAPYPMLPCTKQLMNVYDKHKMSVVGVMEVEEADVSKYGIVGGDPVSGDALTIKVNSLVEKPTLSNAPSRLAIPGRYILDSEIFQHIENTRAGANGEIQLTDALLMLARSKGLLAHRFKGDRYDTGDRLGYLDATLTFGMRRPELRPGLISLLKKHLSHLVVAITTTVAICSFSATAYAYIPPASYIINRMATDRSAVKRVEFTGKITDLKSTLKFDEFVQIDFINEKVSVFLFSEDGKKLFQKEMVYSQLKPLGLAWLGIGADPNGDRVQAALRKLEVSIKSHEDIKLRRVEDRPVWEWGEVAAVQIEKDQFVLAGFKENEQNSFVVSSFTTEGAHVRFPKLIKFKSGGVDQFSYELKKYKLNILTSMKNSPKITEPAVDQALADRMTEWLTLVR